MNVLKTIKNLKKEKIFKGHLSLKEWNLKDLEWFLIKWIKRENDNEEYINDSFYFNEYWKVNTENIMKEFIKKNKKKGKFLYDIIKKGDISLNSTGHIAVSSFLWFSLDKISFISLWYRKKIKMIEIETDEWISLIVTKNQKILTNYGYVKAIDLTNEDILIWIIWSSNIGFKRWPRREYVDIFKLLNSIKKLILKEKDKVIEIKNIEKDLLEYMNILWINTSKWTLSLNEINYLIKGLEKNNIEMDENEFDNLLINNHKDKWRKHFFCKYIKSVKEVEINEGYISSVIPDLAGNYIINNIILEK